MAFKVIFLVTLGVLAASAAVLEHDGDDGPLSEKCIKALYEVLNSPDNEDACLGSDCNNFRMSLDNWRIAYNVRAGEGEAAFTACMSNHWCSVRAVQDFMSKSLALCVRRTPNTDAYRSVCESALILQTRQPADCQQPSNTGILQANRVKLLASLDRLAEKWLTEDDEEDTAQVEEGGESETPAPGVEGLNENIQINLENNFPSEFELTENDKEDSIQGNKLGVNVLEMLSGM